MPGLIVALQHIVNFRVDSNVVDPGQHLGSNVGICAHELADHFNCGVIAPLETKHNFIVFVVQLEESLQVRVQRHQIHRLPPGLDRFNDCNAGLVRNALLLPIVKVEITDIV